MVYGFPSIIFFLLFLVKFCHAGNVTLFLNDTRLVSSPPNWSGFSSFSDLCGGTRWTNVAGQSVSLSFTGTAVTVNFFVEYRGAIAQITLDNAVVPNVVNTFKQGVVDNATCEAISWNSGELSPGNHTVTVTHMASSTYSGAVYLWMRSFVYTETPAGSGSGNGRTVKKKKSSIPAIAAGSAAGVVALLLLTAAVILLRRRRTKSANSPQKPMLDMDALAAVPFSHPSLGGQDQNAQHPAYQTPPAHEGGPAQGSFSYGNGPPSSDASAYQSYQSGAASPYQSGSAYPGGPVFPSGPAYPDGSSYSGGSAYPGGSAYQSGPAYQGAPLNTQDQRTQHDTSSQSYSSTYSPPSTFFVTNSDTSAAPLNPKQAEHAESNSPNKATEAGYAFPTPTSPASHNSTGMLSPDQLDLVRTLAERNVAAPALATVIQSMSRTTGEASSSSPRPLGDEPPPQYDFKDRSS